MSDSDGYPSSDGDGWSDYQTPGDFTVVFRFTIRYLETTFVSTHDATWSDFLDNGISHFFDPTQLKSRHYDDPLSIYLYDENPLADIHRLEYRLGFGNKDIGWSTSMDGTRDQRVAIMNELLLEEYRDDRRLYVYIRGRAFEYTFMRLRFMGIMEENNKRTLLVKDHARSMDEMQDELDRLFNVIEKWNYNVFGSTHRNLTDNEMRTVLLNVPLYLRVIETRGFDSDLRARYPVFSGPALSQVIFTPEEAFRIAPSIVLNGDSRPTPTTTADGRYFFMVATLGEFRAWHTAGIPRLIQRYLRRPERDFAEFMWKRMKHDDWRVAIDAEIQSDESSYESL